jgi:pyruvate dehydrogenase (quinone)
MNAAEALVDHLVAWDIRVVFGLPGDGINGVMEALRQRRSEVRFVQVRHEEAAAFMAVAYAKWTGRIGCCLATSGPGGVHLLNGLYDGKFDRAPVLAITGAPYHDILETFTQQDVDFNKVFGDATVYSSRISGPAHVGNVVAMACRAALEAPGVSHVSIPTDTQEAEVEEASHSPRNAKHRVAATRFPSIRMAPEEELDRAAAVLNAGRRVAILAGQGALQARAALLETADLLAAPIVKALLGKGVVPDAHPLTTGGIGLLGTRPSQQAFEECDTLLIVGSTFPYMEYYPDARRVRCVQIDHDGSRIGLRFPVEVGLAADAEPALAALNGRLQRKPDRSFLATAQARMAEWRQALEAGAEREGPMLKPQRVARDLGRLLPDDAIICADSGHNTGLLARYVEMKDDQRFAVSGLMASMACGLPYAIAAAIAFPERPVVAFVGDGGLTMSLGELATCVRYRLNVTVVVLKNNTLGQIKWEQMLFLGNPEFECDLQPIDFRQVAEAMGMKAFRIERAGESADILRAALAEAGPTLVEAVVDPNEPLLPPKRNEKFARNLEKALEAGTPGAAEIRSILQEEPARTMMEG